MPYRKIGSKFKRKYGMTLKELSKKIGASETLILNAEKKHKNPLERVKELRADKRCKRSYSGMIQRCKNKRNWSYRYYGKRGIKAKITLGQVIDIWNRDNADAMLHPSLDRINPSSHYEPSNCRFIELSENIKRRWG